MPVMNGFDCLIELRKKKELRDLPVVIFTTTSDLDTIKRMYEMGANAFFKKPNEFSIMRAKLESLLTDFSIPKVRTNFSFAQFSL
jgi:DNA-binding response OmpR family regulator